MFDPDPIAMLLGTVLFLAVVLILMAVTAVRRRGERTLAAARAKAERAGTRRLVG